MSKRHSRPLEPGAAPGRQQVSINRPQILAPSLASATVLIALIGLSSEWMLDQAPVQFNATRPRAIGEVLQSAESEPASGQMENSPMIAQKQALGDLPELAMSDRADVGASGRDDDEDFFSDPQTRQHGDEVDALRRNGFREKRLRSEAKVKSENEIAGGMAMLAPPQAPRNQDDRRFAESSLVTAQGFAVPAEESLDESDAEEGKETKIPGRSLVLAKKDFNFLDDYLQTDSLHFQPATGYWANNYIPGDPEIRLLSARLAQWDRSWLQSNASLEREVEPITQPFDAPADNALALSLMADASSVTISEQAHEGTRMRLQVGIQGIEHRRGQRPAMNVGVVVDLPPDAPDELRIATRALLDAMLQSKQAGDRFSLLLAGSGLVVEAADFRFGSLQLAKQHITGQQAESGQIPLSLPDAIKQAGDMVAQTDDPSRPLGSSSVLLISANSIPDINRLAALAHEQARDGVTLSVFPLGSRPQNADVEQLVLAGLGNRRFLEAPGQARQLIEDELHAASRAVARAARLSIRLAPGVRLIEVIGSERLDVRRSERVREIENSMDRRLSTNLGIQADRGQDEDGIQIIIPSIFSGDSVTVLLDVVVERPGAIADVSLRYKDLVFLRNGSLQSRLELPGGELPRGPAQLAVLKNLLSHHFITAVEQAADALGRRAPAEAAAVLSAMNSRIERSRKALPGWSNDPDLIRDQRVLNHYIAALALPLASAHQSDLSDSLRYAAWAKTHRPLEEWIK